MNSEEIRRIMKENNIQDLRSLLSYLGFPDIEYQVYWVISVIETGEYYYVPDIEYFCSSTYEDDLGYVELDEFEKDYYKVELSTDDEIVYNDEEKVLYHFVIKDLEPNEVHMEELDLEYDEYYTFKQILDLTRNTKQLDDENGSDADFDTHANDVANGYGYYDEAGNYISYGPNAI